MFSAHLFLQCDDMSVVALNIVCALLRPPVAVLTAFPHQILDAFRHKRQSPTQPTQKPIVGGGPLQATPPAIHVNRPSSKPSKRRLEEVYPTGGATYHDSRLRVSTSSIPHSSKRRKLPDAI